MLNPKESAFPAMYNRAFGLTKRELFAAMAMQGMLANSQIIDHGDAEEWIAKTSTTHADALIAELNKEQAMVEVHGLPSPPEGFEWHFDEPQADYINQEMVVVARPKWEPKPGEFVDCGFGRRCTFAFDFSDPERTNENKPILLVDEHGSRVFVHPDQIIGPWEPEADEEKPGLAEVEKVYGRFSDMAYTNTELTVEEASRMVELKESGTARPNVPIITDHILKPLAVGDRVKVLPKGDDPLGLWKGTEYRNCGKFGVVSHVYATREFSVRFDGPDNTWAYSRCQLEKLPAETEQEPAIDPGEGYRLLERGEDIAGGDEYFDVDEGGGWVLHDDCVGECMARSHYPTRRKLPVWSPPEWARVLGWMTQDHNHSMVVFWNHRPEFHEPWRQWCRGRVTGIEVNGSFSVETAKALNLYPPHWDTLPASERCVNLGGGT